MHRPAGRAPDTAGTTHAAAGAEEPTGPSSRRQLLRGAGALAALGVLGSGTVAAGRALPPLVDPRSVIPLWSRTVAYDAAEQRVLVGGRAAELPVEAGSRLAASLSARSPARARAAGFREGTGAWTAKLRERLGEDSALLDLADSALEDLWVLGDELPAPVAGWSTPWRYVWPRDAAFCAAALARIGHLDRAVAVLEHLGSLQAEDGWFEARYIPGTDRAPDRRPRQFDGTGLLLWASAEVIDAAEEAAPSRRGELLDRLEPLITRSLGALHAATGGGTALPPVSPDYWEVRERSVTLGLMASTLTGLRAGARLTGSARAEEAAEMFTVLLEGTFGRTGHQRYRSGGGPDSALALLPATGIEDVVEPARLLQLRRELARPGGGIAPGASWREDGVSWTPSTSLLGIALARAGEREAATEIIAWLAAHRTESGSLPEKVLFDGRPAEVAPLSWTAANVLLTLDALARG